MCNCNQPKPCEQTPNICGQPICTPVQDCSCPTRLNSECVTYNGEDLECSGIESGLDLNQTLQLLDQYICDAISQINNSINLINIGTGLQIYAGIDALGRRKIRTLITEGNILTSVQNENDITFGIDENAILQLFTGNQKTYSIENIGSGVGLYKSPDDIVGNNTEFNLKTIVSDSINITDEGDSIRLETIPDSLIKQFYVNRDYTGEETGSILKPYRKLTSALVAAIGTGSITTPEFEGANIILQTDSTVTQADLTAEAILQNKISVNTLTIKAENGYTKRITFEGTTDYPIDTEFLFNEVGVDGALNLNRSVIMRFESVEIYTETVKGIIRSKSYNNGSIDTSKPNCELHFNNGIVVGNYNPSMYVVAKDSLNNNIQLFGTDVYIQDSIVNDTPHILAYGRGTNGEGSFNTKGIKIIGTSQTHLKLINTTLIIEDIEIGTNTYMLPTQSITPSIPGIYLPKTDVYKVHIENSVYRIFNFTDNTDYANNQTDGGVYVGGTNSYFRCENTALLPNMNFRIDGGFIYDSYSNYLIEVDKDFNSVELINCKFNSFTSRINAFNYIGVIGINKNIYIEGSEVKNVGLPSVTNIDISATSAIVNNFPYTSIISFSSNSAALLYGLIPGNIYYNSTTNIATRVV